MDDFSLVLGAGGTVGIAHHIGVLRALDEAGYPPTEASLLIGTSAGSVVAAVLRQGLDLEALLDPERADEAPALELGDDTPVIMKGWRTSVGLARRVVGSSWVLWRSATRWPPIVVPRAMAAFWRGGLASTSAMKDALSELIADDWPDQALWLVSVDIVSGRRIIAGRGQAPTGLSVVDAVRASCAVPGLYPPVRWGRRILVDGGAHSVTNADLAGTGPGRAETVIIVCPMGYDEEDPPAPTQIAIRAGATRRMHEEAARLRRRGHRVLTLVPSAAEIAAHGFDMIRDGDHSDITDLAYEHAAQQLTHRLRNDAKLHAV